MKTKLAIIAACLCDCLPTQAQYINVYPSQDDPTETLWLFSPSPPSGGEYTYVNPHYGSSIRNITATNYHRRDSWKSSVSMSFPDGDIYFNNKPTNQVFTLTPLFSSTNHPKDIDSIMKRMPVHSFGQFTTNTLFFGSTNLSRHRQ